MGVEYDNKEVNLRSVDTMEVILGIGEGPIFGPELGMKSFFIGDTPVMASDGTLNYKGANLRFHGGYGPGEIIRPVLGGIASSINVGVTLVKNVPVIRRTVQKNLNYIDVRLVFSALSENNEKGSYDGHGDFHIEWKPANSTVWVDALNERLIRVTGKAATNTVKEYRFLVDPINDFYDIRVTKVNPAESDQESICVVAWESFQQVLSGPRQWPFTAIAHLNTKASNQLSGNLSFHGIYKGRVVRVPANYNTAARVYTGQWDGTFKFAWTDDPAWCLYDFVTNDRYGLNAYDKVSIDKWDIFEASKWCSEQVLDGNGGRHPRYSLNHTIAEPASGKEVARFMAGIFNATFFDSGDGVAKVRVDKPDDAVHLFVPENVVGGKFEYSFTDMASRYNDITVAFTNPELNWETDRRRIFNQAHITKYGRNALDFNAVGAIHQQEAMRRARYKLITSLTEKMMVTFSTNRLAHCVEPFQVILLGDPRLGFSLTGRLTGLDPVSRRIVEFRDKLFLEAGISYTFNVQVLNPNYPTTEDNEFEIVRVAVSPQAATGLVNRLLLAEALPAAVPLDAAFSLEQVGAGYGSPKPFRVMKISEVEGDPDNFEITAIEVNRLKWDYVDNSVFHAPPNYSYINEKLVPPPSNFEASVSYETINGLARTPVINFSWTKSVGNTVREYEIHYTRNGSTAAKLVDVELNSYDWVGAPAGVYNFRLVAVNVFGYKSPPRTITNFQVVGEVRTIPAPLAPVQPGKGPTDTQFQSENLTVAWTQTFDDPFFLHYEIHIYTSVNNETFTFQRAVRQVSNRYVYDIVSNTADNGGTPQRWVRVYVRQVDRNLNASDFVNRTFYNPPPAMLTNNSVGGFEVYRFRMSGPAASLPDFVGYRIYSSTVAGFTPSPATLMYEGKNNQVTIAGSGTKYFTFTAFDTFDGGDLNYVPIFSLTADGDIDTPRIRNDAITTMQVNNVGGANSTTTGETTSNTVVLANFTTSYNGVGRTLLTLAAQDENYLALVQSTGSSISQCTLRLRVFRRNETTLVETNLLNLSQSFNAPGATGAPVTSSRQLPGCLVLSDTPGVQQSISYRMELLVSRDEMSGRSNQYIRRALTCTVMEYKR
jgi:predicted phage tail protein